MGVHLSQERGSEPDVPKFECVTPILNVASVPASLDYYTGKLGFKTDWTWGDPPTFASVSRGQASIFLCQGGQGRRGTWMSIFMDNVDALYEEYQASGALIRQAPVNMPWNCREMNVEDPDGHRLRMTSHATGPCDGVPLCED